MKVAVLLNAGAGGIGSSNCEERKQEILAACEAAGIDAAVHLCEPAHLTETARKIAAARDVDAIVAAGGDGTVSAVAGALIGHTIPLAVIPLGTLNHFAKDIGMPVGDLADAVRAIAAYQTKRIDVGELNGRIFINNSSIGLYPEIVLVRDAVRRTTGTGKWSAMVRAAARVLRRFPLLRVRIATRERVLIAKTPFVFIGNNAYTLNLFELGGRAALDRGQLSLYMVRSTSRLKMFWLMVRAILQRLDAIADFEAHAISEAVVGTGKRLLKVALDGEVQMMAPPLHYRSRPQALRIVIPPPVVETDVSPQPAAEAHG